MKKVLSDNEVRRLADYSGSLIKLGKDEGRHAPVKNGVLLQLLLYCGLKSCEVTRLKFKHVDADNSKLIWPRPLKLPEFLLENIMYLRRRYNFNDEDLICPASLKYREKFRPSSICHLVVALLAAADIKGSAMTLRYTYARRLLDKSGDVVLTMNRLGYDDLRGVERLP